MIDYKIIDNSIDYYQKTGFTRIETPWMVSKYTDELTKPPGIPSYELVHNGKCLVASGEQSFLYLYLKECLPMGAFQTVTPCFRADRPDDRHSKWFIKNELIKTDVVNTTELDSMIETAYNFYKQYFTVDLDIVKTEIGFDIEVKGNELGSYGIRSCEFLDWIYGTGCAEPRTSKLIKLYGKFKY
jgi:aspartyl/asparaginyl-tRNA synthetase